MALPTCQCVKSLPPYDRLTAIYQAAAELSGDSSLPSYLCVAGVPPFQRFAYIYAAFRVLANDDTLPSMECVEGESPQDQVSRIYQAALSYSNSNLATYECVRGLPLWWQWVEIYRALYYAAGTPDSLTNPLCVPPTFDVLSDVFCAILEQGGGACVTPTLVSAAIDGDIATLVFSENVTGYNGLVFTVNNVSTTITNVVGEGTNTYTITLNIAALPGESVILDYAPGDVTSGACPLEEIFEEPVTNNTSFDADAQAYFDEIVSAGSTISDAQKYAVNDFVVSAKAHSYWDNLIDCSPFCGADLTGALVKLKAFAGSPTSCTNNNFVGADYTETTGLDADGANWLETGVFMDDIGEVGGLSFFQPDKDYTSGGLVQMIGTAFTAPWCLIQFVSDGIFAGWGNLFGGYNPTPLVSGSPYGFGLYRAYSSTTTNHVLGIGDVELSTNTGSATGDKNEQICVFAMPDGSRVWDGRGTWYGIDDGGITGQKAIDFNNDMLALMTALGRAPAQLSDRLNYVIISGQSLACGGNSDLGVLTLDVDTTGRQRMQTATAQSFTTGEKMANLVWTTGFSLEHLGLPFSRHLAANTAATEDVVVDNWALSGAPYTLVKKGTAPYESSIANLQSAWDLRTYYNVDGLWCPAVLIVHGEANMQSADYQADIEEWQADYEADIQAITGQVEGVPMFHSQPSSWTTGVAFTTGKSPFGIYDAAVANPSKTILVCPKYARAYTDGIHLTSWSYRVNGEYYARAYKAVVVDAGSWAPMQPTNVARTGAVVTLTFANRDGNLVLDTDSVNDPGNYGFEWYDDGGPSVTVSSVAIVANTIEVTLSGTPTGSDKRIRYAYTGVAFNLAGPIEGPRGCLRDSSAAVSIWDGIAIGTFTADDTTDVLTFGAAHGLGLGDQIRVSNSGGSLPGGLAAGTTYYVLTVPSATEVTLSAACGGSTLDITSAGSGTQTGTRYLKLWNWCPHFDLSCP